MVYTNYIFIFFFKIFNTLLEYRGAHTLKIKIGVETMFTQKLLIKFTINYKETAINTLH